MPDQVPAAAPPMPMMQGSTAPATVAPSSGGLRMRGTLEVHLAMKALTDALNRLGVTSPEGRAVLDALKILSREFGRSSGDLQRSEVKALGEKAPPVTPGAGAPIQDAIRQRLGAMGMAQAPGAA